MGEITAFGVFLEIIVCLIHRNIFSPHRIAPS
jgi:hypothetical protein